GVGFFQAVDVGVNLVERVGTVGAIVFAVGLGGDGAERVLVHVHGHLLVNFVAGEVGADGHFGHAAGTHTDGVDLDFQGLGGLGGGKRRDAPGVVLAVGHQDDYLALGIQIAQAVHGDGEGGADGGLVTVDDAEIQTINVLQQKIMVERRRCGDVGL